MKRVHKLSIKYLVIAGALMPQAYLTAAVEGEHSAEIEMKRSLEEEKPADILKHDTEEREIAEQKSAEVEEAENPLISESAESSWVTRLGEGVTSLGQQGKEGVIRIGSSSFEAVAKALNTVKATLQSVFSRLRAYLPLSARLNPESRRVFNTIVDQAGQLSKGVLNISSQAIEYNKFLNIPAEQFERQVRGAWNNLDGTVIKLNESVKQFVENSDPANPDAVEAANLVKKSAIEALAALSKLNPKIMDLNISDEDRKAIADNYEKFIDDVEGLQPGVKVPSVEISEEE